MESIGNSSRYGNYFELCSKKITMIAQAHPYADKRKPD